MAVCWVETGLADRSFQPRLWPRQRDASLEDDPEVVRSRRDVLVRPQGRRTGWYDLNRSDRGDRLRNAGKLYGH